MDSVDDHPDGWGFPIRKSSDQSVLATPRSLSQPTTSFIASQCQGIRQTPLLCLISHCQRNSDLAVAVSARSVQGTNPTRRPITLSSPRLGSGTSEDLDFKTSSDKRCQRTIDATFRRREALCPWSFHQDHAGDGGGRRDRTDDLLLAKQALSQLSYAPV